MSARLHTVSLPRPRLEVSRLGFFRWGSVGSKVVLTNDAGEWELLERGDFDALLDGRLGPEHVRWEALTSKGIVREGCDLEDLAARVARKKRFIGSGPHLHIVITTLRCNQDCRYCHASRTDMSLETAKKVVDVAMQSTSPYINFEYQGGEPTVNMDVIKFCVDYSREKNRYEGKTLDHSLVTNMTSMNEEKAEWLLANNVVGNTTAEADAPTDQPCAHEMPEAQSMQFKN